MIAISFFLGFEHPEVTINTKKFLKTFKWNPRFNDIKIIIKSAIKWEKKLKK